MMADNGDRRHSGDQAEFTQLTPGAGQCSDRSETMQLKFPENMTIRLLYYKLFAIAIVLQHKYAKDGCKIEEKSK